MKKTLTLLLMALFGMALSAQNRTLVSPSSVATGEISIQSLAMSQNHTYVVGTDQFTQVPILWNTANATIVMIFAEEQSDEGTVYKTGSFNAVNNQGFAVGSLLSSVTGVTVPIMADAADRGEYTELYSSATDAGASAYGISDDGTVIVGFYFDAAWNTQACIWTNNGQTRTDLPAPTVEQLGFDFDYVAARWISGDGNTILGYAQDYNTGQWVALAWRNSANGYQPLCFANNFFQSYTFDDNYNVVLPENPNPYFTFEPSALSHDGNWVALNLVEVYDLDDWDYVPVTLCGRYNLTTGTFEALNSSERFESVEMFGIADNGTCVGRMTGEMDMVTYSSPIDGVIWSNAANSDLVTIKSRLPEDSYIAQQMYSSLMDITKDGAFVMGYGVESTGTQTAFVAQIGEPAVGISPVTSEEVAKEGIFDMMGRKLNSVPQHQHGIFFVNGKKVVR